MAVLKLNELSLIERLPTETAIAPPHALDPEPVGLSAPTAAHSSITLSTTVSEPLLNKTQPPSAETPPGVIEPRTRPFARFSRRSVTAGALAGVPITGNVPISNNRKSGVPTVPSRLIELLLANWELVIAESS